ncbi:MAG TPA: DnaJ family domain-containing protein [Vicinamibacteria bacterium]|nr:DnaJ family domain-containing protein [Vicinamibacteria bacterium]
MDYLARIAERRIEAALERGELRCPELEGKPLRFDSNAFVPDDLRIAYKLLKDAGFLPPEMELRKEIVTLKELLAAATDGEERVRIARELNRRVLRLNLMFRRAIRGEEAQVALRSPMGTKSRCS